MNHLVIYYMYMETIGSLIDKISIIELKRYHMEEQTKRRDVDKTHIKECCAKLQILNQQRDKLIQELDQLFEDIVLGKEQLKIYRKFNMYNEPKYKLPNR